MDEQLWHQVVRRDNYEPLDDDEAAAVTDSATAILSRPGSSGRESAADHRSQFTQIGYHIQIRGWDAEPPVGRPELGGLTIHQLHPILQRAVHSATKYITSTKRSSLLGGEATTSANPSLERVRERLRRKKQKEEDDKS